MSRIAEGVSLHPLLVPLNRQRRTAGAAVDLSVVVLDVAGAAQAQAVHAGGTRTGRRAWGTLSVRLARGQSRQSGHVPPRGSCPSVAQQRSEFDAHGVGADVPARVPHVVHLAALVIHLKYRPQRLYQPGVLVVDRVLHVFQPALHKVVKTPYPVLSALRRACLHAARCSWPVSVIPITHSTARESTRPSRRPIL